ncbi:disulfide bond formation protein DsbA [Candidatus Roizmanbacteria bacterium CG_4_9_14_0_2_um_filter_39_13]|uniref:Disulfide bond formation protein DsbA n=2 Tax=Candidatus Roizmaniibacteriota TaxID=1752723 RepID=A0A2M8EYD3_9BACT|nr:MAG: disulfide bond formation protein DsbA [Candidatus Roizmanbacteria bacterium CG_4_10_14_0_2_um_filter_39_12]PJC31445.1 MAG: disulfide bond formation protein DsbA [Candidatus Roizmanbacteria bacterium CG_4_9_14_0_2_um_filter_39_13]PJE61647.1 MAG: disulfide bond formation protein DsbA [Candidatus Roizmanbacteria bacterium CG10_big_fil_rev_8_21_14_0_10_39_12]
MDYKKILMIGGGIAIIFVLLLGAFYLTSKPQQTSFPQLTKLNSDDQVRWATESANILIEYSDFQCPACGTYFGLIESLNTDEDFVTNAKNKIAFVYRHFPLDNAHPNARVAAYAAEAAGYQGKFWQMHDLLFTRQEEWSESDKPEELFKEYAKEIELDLELFETDRTSSKTADRVQNNYRSGLDVKVQGTPTFFLNGVKLQNPNSAENFQELLSDGIQSKDN